MLKSYKYRIYPTAEQEELFVKTFGCVRVVWNWALEIRDRAYRERGEVISTFTLLNRMKRELKAEKEWLYEVSAPALQASIVNLGKAYDNFYHHRAQFPKFKSKNDSQSFQCPQYCSVDFEQSTITIPKAKNIPAVLHRHFEGKVKTVTISRSRTGKYFASVLVDDGTALPQQTEESEEKTTIGISTGIGTLAVLSDGRRFETPHYGRDEERKMRKLRRRLVRKTKGSCAWQKTRQRMARLQEKIVNRRTDYQHKITHQLTHESQVRTICVRNLKIQEMKKNRYIARYVNDASVQNFLRMLEYKCLWQGIRLIKIGDYEPTSQLCHVCGYRNTSLKIQTRRWTCPVCGTQHERDLNAAMNIKDLGLGLKKALPSERGEEKPVELHPVDEHSLRKAKKQRRVEAGKAGRKRPVTT